MERKKTTHFEMRPRLTLGFLHSLLNSDTSCPFRPRLAEKNGGLIRTDCQFTAGLTRWEHEQKFPSSEAWEAKIAPDSI